MLFNSIHFLFFFVLVSTAYFLLSHKYRWFLLLASSCYFYMAFIPVYILILGFTIVLDYFAGILIEKSQGRKRFSFLILSLAANIGILCIFKYYNFLNENLSFLLHGAGYENPVPYLSILLPIGLSFHTFQAMSYTIEVYRGNQRAERNFGIYALYVMFYPQLVAGPIERPQNLLSQFYEKHSFEYQRVTDGLKLMAWGLLKKVVIADRLALMVNQVYDSPTSYEGLSLLLATFFFTFQVYCDFSGYSDIAIGAAEVMGFKLMTNFNKPYFSGSVSEFWKRWHISLSTWFKDYLYIPLGGNKVAVPRWYFNLFIVFLLSGLWHGANWTFIVWGALHGFYLVFALITSGLRENIIRYTGLNKESLFYRSSQVLITFALVSFTWIFFRANTIADALYIVNHLFSGWMAGIKDVIANNHFARQSFLYLGLSSTEFMVACLSILFLLVAEYYQGSRSFAESISFRNKALRWSAYYLIVMAIIILGVYNVPQQFIYFQF
ncbi:MAG: MBOAT family O-acyltransferase [Cytophagaceae bacterium]